MSIYSELIKKGEDLFRTILNKRDRDHDKSYIEWYSEYREIAVTPAWRKVWFSYHKKRFYSISAAAVILVLVSILLFTPNQIATEESYVVQILPASDNILLRSADGSMIIVDSLLTMDTLIKGLIFSKEELRYSDEDSDLFDNRPDSQVSKGENNKLRGKGAKENITLEMNELYVPKGRMYSLVLSDGSKIWLNSESSVKYPVKFGDKERRVTVSGEVFFDIRRDGRAFIVETTGYSVNVIGTKFNLSAYENDETISTTLVDGSVSIVTDENSEFLISPGEQFTLEKSSKTISVKEVDVNKYTCWINNELRLDKNTLQDIFKVLQRRYDIHVFFSNENAKFEKYSGDLPLNDNLNIILNQISKVSDIEFQIEGKLVVVRYK